MSAFDLIINRIQTNDSTLRSLDLAAKFLNSSQIDSLAHALKYNTVLTSLDLRCNNIDPIRCRVLAQALQVNTGLKSLILKNNNIGSLGCQFLAQALKVNSTMTSLDLQGNHIDSYSFDFLATDMGIHRSSRLTHLNLRYNHAYASGIFHSQGLTSITSLFFHLKSLNLRDNDIGDHSCTCIAHALRINPNLQSLNLRYNRIDKGGGQCIVDALVKNPKHSALIYLNLKRNHGITPQFATESELAINAARHPYFLPTRLAFLSTTHYSHSPSFNTDPLIQQRILSFIPAFISIQGSSAPP
jgi:Ran GTPase-activating protein (RanGAP) involved in mRNA processing and transport